MSVLRVKCLCGKTLRVPTHLKGKRVECPVCGGTNLVADPSGQSMVPTPQPEVQGRFPWGVLVGALVVFLCAAGVAVVLRNKGQNPGAEDAPTPVTTESKELKNVNGRIESQAGERVAKGPLELCLQVGHSGRLAPTALSGDGSFLVSGSADTTALLWDISSGKRLQAFHGHTSAIASVAVSDGGKHVVTGSDDGTAILWEVASGKQLHTFKGTTVATVALSGDGKYVVISSGTQTILWESASGTKLQTFKGHSDFVSSLAVSGDGKYVVTAGEHHKAAILWDGASGKQLQTFKGTGNYVTSVALSADGKYLITGCSDHNAILWEVDGARKLQNFPSKSMVGLSDDGKFVVAGSKDDETVLWDAASGKKVQSFPGHLRGSRMLSRDAKRLVTRSADSNSLFFWDASSGNKLRTLLPATISPVTGLALSGDGKRLVTGAKDPWATLWDVSGGTKHRFFAAGSIESVGISGNGQRILTSSVEKTILWDVAEDKMIQTYSAPRFCSAALSADGRTVVLSSRGGINGVQGKLTVWADDGKVIREFVGLGVSAVVSGDGKGVLTATNPPIIWDAVSGKILRKFEVPPGDITSVAISDDGKYVATGRKEEAIIWEAGGKQLQTFTGHRGFVSRVALSTAGKYVVAAGEYQKAAILWEVAGPKRLHTIQGHTDWITGLALSGDGKCLWSASADGSTRLWDPATGKERCRLYSFGASADWLVVTPDGYFDSSPGARHLLTYRVPGTLTLVDEDATRAHFHRPGLLAAIWRGTN